jgi:hypothetical protein
MRLALAAPALAAAVALAGCGGSKHAATVAPGGYTLAATQKCLDTASGIHAYAFRNKVVSGSAGELRVTFGYGLAWIYMVFGRDAHEAKAIEGRAVAATVQHEHIRAQTVRAGVRVRRNVFYYSDSGPVTVIEGSKIDGCLR